MGEKERSSKEKLRVVDIDIFVDGRHYCCCLLFGGDDADDEDDDAGAGS